MMAVYWFCRVCGQRLSQTVGEVFQGQHLLPPSFDKKGRPLCPNCAWESLKRGRRRAKVSRKRNDVSHAFKVHEPSVGRKSSAGLSNSSSAKIPGKRHPECKAVVRPRLVLGGQVIGNSPA